MELGPLEGDKYMPVCDAVHSPVGGSGVCASLLDLINQFARRADLNALIVNLTCVSFA